MMLSLINNLEFAKNMHVYSGMHYTFPVLLHLQWLSISVTAFSEYVTFPQILISTFLVSQF
jgi:hypothetical protein